MPNKYNNLSCLLAQHDRFGDIPDYAGSHKDISGETTHDALQYYMNHSPKDNKKQATRFS